MYSLKMPACLRCADACIFNRDKHYYFKNKKIVDKTVLRVSQEWFILEDWLNRNRKVRHIHT